MTVSLLRGRRSGRLLIEGARLLLVTVFFLWPASAYAADQNAGILSWLMSPIDPARGHAIDVATSWHGRLMVLVWAVLFPAGILAARFFKIMPGQDWPRTLDDKRWWRTHLFTQYAGGALLLLAFGLAFYSTGRGQGLIIDLHHVFGWFIGFLAASQFLGGWLRGTKGGPTDPRPDGSFSGDHYEMSRRRRLFEYAHKTGGYLALMIAVAAVTSGLYAANAPRWMWLGVIAWWCLLVGLAAWLQIRGFARDTYEAIWGPGDKHPGNRLRPIGLGIKRLGNKPSGRP